MKTKDLEVLFPVWHDFEKDLKFFEVSDRNILESTISECERSKDYEKNQAILEEVFFRHGSCWMLAHYDFFRMRADLPELVALLSLVCIQKDIGDDAIYEKLNELIFRDIVLIAKIDAIVCTLNSCHFFVSGVMYSTMDIAGCKKITFKLAKNIFATRALLDSEPIRMSDVVNIVCCLTPLFRELHAVLYAKDPNGYNTQRVSQLVEVFEAMSTFIGIEAESGASEATQSEKLETASVSAEA